MGSSAVRSIKEWKGRRRRSFLTWYYRLFDPNTDEGRSFTVSAYLRSKCMGQLYVIIAKVTTSCARRHGGLFTRAVKSAQRVIHGMVGEKDVLR